MRKSAGEICRRSVLSALFFVAAMPVLVFLALSVPPGEIPDEVPHILRADSVRHGEVAGFRRPRVDFQGDPAIDAMVLADPALLFAGISFSGVPLEGKHETLDRIARARSIVWANRLDPVSVPNTGVYPPFFYLPAAAGLGLASHYGYSPYDAIFAARLMNVLAYLALGAAALFFAERGRALLFAILCLPMSLALAASASQDGIAIACSVLAGSLLSGVRQDKLRWIIGTAALAFAAMAKPFLLPMALIVLTAVPGGFRRNIRLAAAGFALATVPAILWGGAMARWVAAPFVLGPATPAGPLWPGPAGTMFATTNPAEQLRVFLSCPSCLVTLPLDSAWEKGILLWRETLGVLGTLDVALPGSLYSAWEWALAAALLAGLISGGGGARVDWRSNGQRLAAAIGGLAGLWMIYLLQYLSWTRVGESLVDGVQGRYFIPVAALALPFLATPLLGIPGGLSLRRALTLPVVILALSSIATLSDLILTAYYLR